MSINFKYRCLTTRPVANGGGGGQKQRMPIETDSSTDAATREILRFEIFYQECCKEVVSLPVPHQNYKQVTQTRSRYLTYETLKLYISYHVMAKNDLLGELQTYRPHSDQQL